MKRKILIVEDDYDDVYFFKQALRHLPGQYQVIHLRNGQEFLDFTEKYPNERIGLVLLDLNMPGVNGRSVFQALSIMLSKPKWPIVVYTTSSRDEDIEYAYRYGAHSYIVKPDTISQLTQVLQRTFDYWFNVVEHPVGQD